MHVITKGKKCAPFRGRRRRRENKGTKARLKFFFSFLTSSNKFRPSFLHHVHRRERSLVRIFEGLFVGIRLPLLYFGLDTRADES